MSEGPGGPQGATAGGTLAMRMLSQQAMVASQMKRAANDKAIAQMLASKKSGPPAMKFSTRVFWGRWQGPCWGR
ncbi:TPA: type IV secretion protein Rhs [Escherichia coli]|nr:type IV secretion protein Rhs [Escherichia coli]